MKRAHVVTRRNNYFKKAEGYYADLYPYKFPYVDIPRGDSHLNAFVRLATRR